MTWGTSKYKMKGVHEIARDNSRVVVSGHAAEVGIVGWSMGGGHSPLGPLHGLGVDQMLEVELVGADGSYIIANEEGTSVKSAGIVLLFKIFLVGRIITKMFIDVIQVFQLTKSTLNIYLPKLKLFCCVNSFY